MRWATTGCDWPCRDESLSIGFFASSEAVAKAILYTSTEPCAMCAGAIYWLGVKKVVFSFPESELLQLIGQHPDNPCLHLPTAKVYELGGAKIEVVGPLLEKEGLAVHHKFGWKL